MRQPLKYPMNRYRKWRTNVIHKLKRGHGKITINLFLVHEICFVFLLLESNSINWSVKEFHRVYYQNSCYFRTPQGSPWLTSANDKANFLTPIHNLRRNILLILLFCWCLNSWRIFTFCLYRPCIAWPRGYKTVFMLSSTEHENFPAQVLAF